MYAPQIEALIKAFMRLPAVGRRSAERYVFALLKSGKKDVAELSNALRGLFEQVQSCQICWDFSASEQCDTCSKPNRDESVICVVAEPQEKRVIEQTASFRGSYHVLRGRLRADAISPGSHMKVDELKKRIQKKEVQEVILALSPDLRGETTMLYLEQTLARPGLKITRLARGIPMGSDLQYADEITLESALKNRQ